jgi:hypothetical protein
LDRLGYSGKDCIIALNSKPDYPYDHIIVVKKGPLTAQERTALTEQIKRHGYQVVEVPDGLRSEKQQKKLSWWGGDLLYTMPATDDRPFFFHIASAAPLDYFYCC